MDFPKLLENPVVLIGGAALGLVLLMSGRGAANAATTGTSGPSSGVLAYNMAGLQAVTAQYHDQVDLAKTGIAADVTTQLAAYQTLQNLQNNETVVKGKMIDSNTGIVQSAIASSTAITLDTQNNTNRLGLAYVTLEQQKVASNAAVQIAQEQAKAAKSASTNGLIGQILGTVASVVAAPFTGGMSLASLPGLFSGGGSQSPANLTAAGFTNTGPVAGDPIF